MPTPPRIWSSAAPLLKVRQMSSPSRRTILTASVLVGLGIHRTASAAEIAASGLPAAPTLPGGLFAYVAVFRNWSGEIAIDATWRVNVSSADQVAALANWAAGAGWKLRASGYSHN